VSQTRFDFLTNKPVEGQLLSDKLSLGPISADEALYYAVEIGGAINQIHTAGVMHGSLSPQAVALTADGVRLLKPLMLEDHAPYASPEETRGEKADFRGDIFAYGAIVYEMMAGRPPFRGLGPELKRSIATQTPPPLSLPGGSGAALAAMVGGCLEKDPTLRRQRIRSAVIELKLAGRMVTPQGEIQHHGPVITVLPPAAANAAVPVRVNEAPPAAPQSASPITKMPPLPDLVSGGRILYGNGFKRRLSSVGGAILALAASGLAAVLYLHQRPAPAVLKFAVTQPEHTSYPGMPAVSPDGRYLTFSAVGPEGKRLLWLRPLDALHATVISGTEGASSPFWSPDSQYIAFFAARNLMKVGIKGGSVETICPAEASPGGGAWNKDGMILFAPNLSGGFFRVPSGGGKPQPVLKLDESKNERGDQWPQFLPDGRHFVFYQQTDSADTSGVYVGSADNGQYKRLFPSQTNAVYSAENEDAPNTGYLLYINERNLTAVKFNASKLETFGEPITLANDIGAVRSLALAPISVSANRVLVYQGVGQPTREVVWMDRTGKQTAVSGEPGEYGPVRISPDGNRAVVSKLSKDGKTAHLWLLDSSGGAQQITDGNVHEGSPVWSPDGSKIAYFAAYEKVYDIYQRVPIPGGRSELLLRSDISKFPTDWSKDGRYILFGVKGPGTDLDIWGLSAGDRRSAPIMNTVFSESFASVSPDGKWMAYQSDQGGKIEVYIQAFDGLNGGTKRRWQISKGQSGMPRWRSDSSELFYITADGRMMAVAVHTGNDGGIEATAPQFLFQTRPVPKTWNFYDVSGDGQRFVLNMPLEWTSANPITVVTNWTEKLRD
jgi:Tol biopolymer transport system component